MGEIAPGVTFGVIAREWRCKWSDDAEKKSLELAQKALNLVLERIKSVDDSAQVQRVVCGQCKDFKVITSLPAIKFSDWDAKKFEPEAEFLAELGKIEGISHIETQTYTLMKM
uniref:Uncharacterized protein n=1 Tax=Alexandrium andersonii TaxID=327968 RepID=A0A7S2B4G5_9DINO|mmetsp:Transcript_21904/g.49908  ORF Transcript_21904/g.49908 Transcript_21904/m.49908 type:complete len:113 (+) Transcript_21904:101-439(+)